jgi:hypothetical protein
MDVIPKRIHGSSSLPVAAVEAESRLALFGTPLLPDPRWIASPVLRDSGKRSEGQGGRGIPATHNSLSFAAELRISSWTVALPPFEVVRESREAIHARKR